MNIAPGMTRVLATYVHDTSYHELPSAILEQSKILILDWFAAAIAGSTEKVVDTLMEGLSEVDPDSGTSQATIIGKGIRTSALRAALINGTMSHSVEIDDYHSEAIIHPSVTLLPAIFAVAEQRGLSGKEVMAAFILGFEVLTRIGLAAGRAHYEKGWHTTSTIGRFGATAGVGKLIKLSVEEFINGFGLAGTQAGGFQQVFGTMCKAFHAGKAGMDGLLSAVLAKKGFTSSKEILEGDLGFLALFSGNRIAEKSLDGLGTVYHIMSTTIKPYASCAFTHAAIDAMREICRKTDIKSDHVESIHIEVNSSAIQVAGKIAPDNGTEAKFSIPHCAAVALTQGSAGIEMFTDEIVHNDTIAELRKKITLIPGREGKTLFGAKGSVRMKDGRQYVEEIDYPKGDPKNRLSYAEVVSKMHEACGTIYTKQKLSELVSRIEGLSELEDVGLLFKP